jgi:NADH-quinone oxidoreductase subunit M
MVQKVFYGEANSITINMQDILFSQKFILAVLVVFIFLFGVFPQPIIELTKDTVLNIITRFK